MAGAVREGVLELADGRRLAYAELGAPEAPPVIYCHGSPGSRRELGLIVPALQATQARLIAFNRPGYGPSTFKAGYGFLDWPADVADAADQLGIGRFAMIGASGGSPFALACGYSLPKRVSRIGIVVGSAPPEATGMKEALGTTEIPANPLVRRLQYGMIAVAVRTGLKNRLAEQRSRLMEEPDRHALGRPEVRNWFMAVSREAFSGGGRGAAHEARLYLRPWGFDITRVTTETLLWYGGADTTDPPSAGRWLAERLPNSTFTVWPQHGHFSWAASDEAREVIAAMTLPDSPI